MISERIGSPGFPVKFCQRFHLVGFRRRCAPQCHRPPQPTCGSNRIILYVYTHVSKLSYIYIVTYDIVYIFNGTTSSNIRIPRVLGQSHCFQNKITSPQGGMKSVPEKKTRHLGSSQMGWTINYKHLSISTCVYIILYIYIYIHMKPTTFNCPIHVSIYS